MNKIELHNNPSLITQNVRKLHHKCGFSDFLTKYMFIVHKVFKMLFRLSYYTSSSLFQDKK